MTGNGQYPSIVFTPIFTDKDAVIELDTKLKEERKQSGEMVSLSLVTLMAVKDVQLSNEFKPLISMLSLCFLHL